MHRFALHRIRETLDWRHSVTDKILVPHEELHRYIRDVLVALGAKANEAGTVADGLVWANLRGVDGHGVSRLPRYIGIIKRGEIDTGAAPRLVHDRPATFMIDSGHGFGPVACMQAAALAVERAKLIGICYGIVRETTHTGAIGRYAQWIAQQNCAGLVMGCGPALMAFYGTRVASMATSPIAIAVPSGNGVIVLDMATSTISNGKILQARATGESLPPGTVLTADGEPTTDPKQAEILLPLGGPKGSGLGLMFEMLVEHHGGGADPVARTWPGEPLAPRRQPGDARHRYRKLPPARRFRARCRRAGRHPQRSAAASGLRRGHHAGRARRPHRDGTP